MAHIRSDVTNPERRTDEFHEAIRPKPVVPIKPEEILTPAQIKYANRYGNKATASIESRSVPAAPKPGGIRYKG